MANILNSAANAFATGYDFAAAKEDKSGKTAYQRYVEKFYGPGVTSHRDPLAVARAATGAVAQGLKSGAGFAASFGSHAASALVGMPRGPSSPSRNTGGGIGSDTGAVNRGDMSSVSREGSMKQAGRLVSPVSGTFARNSSNVYGASRSGGTREHSGIDWRAENGSSVYSMAGGKVLYTGTNKGYGSNIVIQENDGTIRRYATHDSVINARPGTTIRPGQVIGTIGENHLHYEEVPETLNGKPNPVYAEMVSSPGKFVLTSHQRGTVNPVVTLGLEPGAVVQGGYPLAYTSPTATSPAQQAAARQAAGGDPQVAQLQQDLNAQIKMEGGTALEVDGIIGSKTKAAMQKYGYAIPDSEIAAYTSRGRAGSTSQSRTTGGQDGGYERSPQIAQMQRDLNSRGASLTVDGIRGPLTMAAEKQFLGSPTSVRTPGFTNTPAQQAAKYASSRQYGDFESQRATQRTAMNPYTSGTGGANAIVAPSEAAYRAEADSPAYRGFESIRAFRRGGPSIPSRDVQTENIYAFDAVESGYPALQPSRFAPQGQNQWSQLQGPYTTGTGGANAIVAPTARLPRARPVEAVSYTPFTPAVSPVSYTPFTPSAPIPSQQARMPRARPDQEQAVPTLIERLNNLVERAERVVGGNSDSKRGSSSNSGSSRSGGSNYSGGNYGGSGGSRISEGVGGAYRNR